MVRVVGIDPGTTSFDLCGIAGERLILDESIPTAQVIADPQTLVERLASVAPVELVLGPSGYGLPWVPLSQMEKRELDLALLSYRRERGRDTIIGGMRELLTTLQETDLPILFAPAVIHLPTVPAHRKANRIDMGTADKLCAAALGVYDQARHLDITYEETSFVYVELGGAFTAIVAVDGGQIVDGVGGSAGPLGYRALGGMDGELAYLLDSFPKGTLCSGGVADIAGQPEAKPETLIAQAGGDPHSRLAWEAFFEGLVKGVAAEMTVVAPREILLSGRLCRVPELYRQIASRLAAFAPVRRVNGFAQTAKEAAQGAALIAEGLAGGIHAGLVETMRLREASGTVLDHLYVRGADALRQQYQVRRTLGGVTTCKSTASRSRTHSPRRSRCAPPG